MIDLIWWPMMIESQQTFSIACIIQNTSKQCKELVANVAYKSAISCGVESAT